MKRTRTLLATMTTIALALSGCSNDESDSDNTSGSNEKADAKSGVNDGDGGEDRVTTPSVPVTGADGPGRSIANNEKPFRFASGELPLGTFDPTDSDVMLFDPCKSISEEELKQVGLEPSPLQMTPFPYAAANCTVEDPEGYMVELTSGKAKLSSVTSSGDEELPTGSKVPGAATFTHMARAYTMCITAVETPRGVFGVRVATPGADKPVGDLCARADTLLDALYDLG